MDRLAEQQLDQLQKQNTTMDHLPYPWPIHDANKGEIGQEIESLKRAVGQSRQVQHCCAAVSTMVVQCQSCNSRIELPLSIALRVGYTAIERSK